MFYERKIKYLDYLQNAERQHGAGFVKIEVRETVCNITIQVSGLPQALCGEKDVFLTDGRKEGKLGSIKLEKGRGSLMLQDLCAGELGRSGISYGNLRALSIPIGVSAKVHCVWSEKPAAETEEEVDAKPEEETEDSTPDQTRQHREELDLGKNSFPEEDFAAEKFIQEEEKDSELKIPQERKVTAEPEFEAESREAEQPFIEQKVTEKAFAAEESKAAESPSEPYPPARRTARLRESKWKQLCDIYPHIQPFQDKRDYLSISPADFVIFPEKYYRMANNSFLLHGYYNYEHLIFARVEKRGEAVYYIGVPGNFYEREKQVAVMFGFESFECMEEPARQGDFGYYMMRLEL